MPPSSRSPRRACLAGLAMLLTTVGAGAAPAPAVPDLRLDQIQVVGTHNSYALPGDPRVAGLLGPRLSALRQARLAALDPAARAAFDDQFPDSPADVYAGLDYVQTPIEAQLRRGVRNIELDLHPDPAGGLFADPLPYRLLAARGETDLAPLYGDVLRRPGIKVLHVPDVDFRSQCPSFRQCLTIVRSWSDAHPGHSPLFVMLEPKLSDLSKVLPGSVRAAPFDAAAFAEIDETIRTVMGPGRVFTPDMLRGDHPTLEAAARAHEWPTMSAMAGRTLFLMLVPGMDLTPFAPYLAERPSLQGRMAFLQGRPGMAHAAFVPVDNAVTHAAEIRRLVADGYLVRTRADIDTVDARRNDSRRRDAALASGAQIVATDHLDAPNLYGNGYHLSPFAGGWRPNPVTARSRP